MPLISTCDRYSPRSRPSGAGAGPRILSPAASARDRSRDRGIPLTGLRWFDDAVALAGDPGADAVVELIGGTEGPARAVVESALALNVPVIVVDDGSDDRTPQIVGALPVTLLSHPRRRGKGEALLRPVILGGRLVEPLPTLEQARRRAAESLARLPAELRQLEAAEPWPVIYSRELRELIEQTRRNLATCAPSL